MVEQNIEQKKKMNFLKKILSGIESSILFFSIGYCSFREFLPVYETINLSKIEIVQPKLIEERKDLRKKLGVHPSKDYFELTCEERRKYGNPDYSKVTSEEAIEYVQKPSQANTYCFLHHNREEFFDFYSESFKENHLDRTGVCIDAAVASAALLSDNNYPPLILVMFPDSGSGHGIFLYKTKKGYGTSGISSTGQTKCKSVEELVKYYNHRKDSNYSFFGVFNLDDLYPNKEWIDGDIHGILRGKNPRKGMIHVK